MPEPDEQPSEGALAHVRQRLARADWVGGSLSAGLLAFVALGAAWILAPGSLQRLPGDDALGTPAAGTFKASRDYEIEDEDATRRRRADALLAERTVYDYDEGAVEDAAARIRGAFELMREGAPPSRRRAAEDPAEIRRLLASRRDAFLAQLGARVSDDDLAALERARFSEAAEDALVSLAAHGVSGMVARDLSLIAAERDRGLVARSVRAGVERGEHIVADVAVVRDLAMARADVERAGTALPAVLPPRLASALVRIAVAVVRPTLTLAEMETQRRRADAVARVKPVVVPVRRGEKIVGDGERIERRHLAVFRAIRAQARDRDRASVRLGAAALVALLVGLLWRHARSRLRAFRPARKDAVLLAVALLGTLALAAAGLTVGDALHDRFPAVPAEAFHHLVPFAAGAMLVSTVLSAEVALLFSIVAGVGVGLVAGQSLFFALHALLTSVAASGLAGRARDRAGIFRAGAAVGLLAVALVVAVELFTERAASDALLAAAGALAGGAVLLPVLVVGLLPVLESGFGYATDVKLLELANLNHPALKELIVQAPGTYHHAIIMGSLVEAGADAIGANALLAKVCAYFHDLGKIRNPLYFAENQRGDNGHDHLAASMSALIVKRHVTDGLELAAYWKLPRAICDAIAQHHGTRLVSFFWAKAQAEQGGAPADVGPVDEAVYRYAGPKPRTREAALVMIADACEASARALPERASAQLTALVQKRINEIFSEGQLDDCDLTLKDLNAIAAAMVRALEAVYHGRPAYPGRSAEDRCAPVHRIARR